MNIMDRIDELEKENYYLKEENKLLNHQIDNYDETLENLNTYNEYLKQNLEKLKEQLKHESFYYEWQATIDENEKLKRENKTLKDDKYKYIELYKQKLDEIKYYFSD